LKNLTNYKGGVFMRTIKKLDNALISKIAAGEVVENPASVVKELLENSIDSGASSITVEIEKAGKKLIRVTDNGSGIPGSELHLAFERHATSKLYSEKDLFQIKSLGFRGEALASIAAVSELEITTKTDQNDLGKRATMNNGGLIDICDIGSKTGTTVVCRNLFNKIPARLNFLKSNTIETNRIIDVVNRLATAQNQISFKLISEKKHLYTTPGNMNLSDAVYSIHGKGIAGNLARVDYFHQNMHLHGLVSNLQNSHSNRSMQSFYVNGRWIKSPFLSKLLNGAFFHILEKRRYPVSFLFIDIHPSSIDINISPNKTEIKFKDEKSVSDIFKRAFSELMENYSWIPEEKIHPKPNSLKIEIQNEQSIHEKATSYLGSEVTFVETNENISPLPFNQTKDDDSKGGHQSSFEALLSNISIEGEPVRKEKYPIETQMERKKDYFKNLKLIGQVFDSYIICEDPVTAEMILIDQHAAHEKIIYESFVNQLSDKDILSQVLLEPFALNMPETEKRLLLESQSSLHSLGFAIEDFGPNMLLVREAPSIFPMQTSISFLEELKDMILNTASVDSMKSEEMIYSIAVKACHSAIRANDSLEKIELEALLSNMDGLINPYTCPHGRPTIVRIGVEEIEKYFNR